MLYAVNDLIRVSLTTSGIGVDGARALYEDDVGEGGNDAGVGCNNHKDAYHNGLY